LQIGQGIGASCKTVMTTQPRISQAKRHDLTPWAYVRHILSESAARKPDAGWADLLPDAWPYAFANRTPIA
jgi:hypothetical protein